jgi:predicted metal-binding membrane protein
MIIPQAIAHHEHMHHIVSFQAEFLSWCLMVMAMMAPLMLEPLRWLAFQSFRHRRHKAIFLFLIGFLLPWMIAGVAAVWLRTLDGNNPLLAPVTFVLAALWVLVPVRRHALVFCHRTVPLAPSGWNADRDCLRYSLLIGASCIVTCGFLMLACALTGHNLVAMLGGTALSALERRSFRPPTGRIFAGALLLAAWFLLSTSYAMLP